MVSGKKTKNARALVDGKAEAVAGAEAEAETEAGPETAAEASISSQRKKQ